MPKQSNKAELALRVEAIRRLLGQGWSRYDIVQFGSRNWRITERQVDDYIAKARVVMLAELSKDRSEHIAEHLEFRRDLRRKAIENKQYRDALAAAQDEAKLTGLYPTEQTNLTGNININVTYGSSNSTEEQAD